MRIAHEPLGAFAEEHTIARCVIVHHIDHDLHPKSMRSVDQDPEIAFIAQFRVDRPVVADGIRAAEGPFPPDDAYWMNGHQPQNVSVQSGYPLKVLIDACERPLGRVIPREDFIDDGASDPLRGIGSHCDDLLGLA